MQRIVHLDLKGAPPKVQYLEKFLILIKSWGATGILLEWEDTFPYSSELVEVGSYGNGDELYSINDVKHILEFAKQIGLEPIQLVQTIGHLEFVLKHPKFAHLREYTRSPAVLCPCRIDSQVLVMMMLEQVLNVQPDAAYLHIGADEVWHTALCIQCQNKAASNEHKKDSLFLDHITKIALFIKQKRPELTLLMWDDMIRSMSLDTLRAYQLGDIIQPVLWQYNPMECFQIDVNLLSKYKLLFNSIWAGSAYKGANGSCQILSPVYRYVSNHRAWMRIFKDTPGLHFSGIILTGWSRYDHYGTLCELLPVSLPSLANCLRLLTTEEANEFNLSEVLPSEQWPGEEFARCVHSFAILRERCLEFMNSDAVTSWLNPWQIENNYTQPIQVESIAAAARLLLTDLTTLHEGLTTHLQGITGARSSEEWLGTFVQPVMKKLTELSLVAQTRSQADASIRPMKNFV